MVTEKGGRYSLLRKLLYGLSTDTKPTNVANGSGYVEMDTGKRYRFDEENATWHEQPTSGGGGGDFVDLEEEGF